MQTLTAMRRALRLAQRQQGRTFPNPSVGCVILDAHGIRIGEGATGPGGRPHAEESALSIAGKSARGGHAVVTLEPCNQRSTDAPSCTERLIESGVGRVTIAVGDPHPLAAGQGVARLRAAGLLVELGLMETEARVLNAGFFQVIKTGLPRLEVSTGQRGFDGTLGRVEGDVDVFLRELARKGYTRLSVTPHHPQIDRLTPYLSA
jgi:diaminohydroxyphosphoribosylaminopyrimidine deaminase / 5-amino-6-(5-phosphoribosylamino)uracil reductase